MPAWSGASMVIASHAPFSLHEKAPDAAEVGVHAAREVADDEVGAVIVARLTVALHREEGAALAEGEGAHALDRVLLAADEVEQAQVVLHGLLRPWRAPPARPRTCPPRTPATCRRWRTSAWPPCSKTSVDSVAMTRSRSSLVPSFRRIVYAIHRPSGERTSAPRRSHWPQSASVVRRGCRRRLDGLLLRRSSPRSAPRPRGCASGSCGSVVGGARRGDGEGEEEREAERSQHGDRRGGGRLRLRPAGPSGREEPQEPAVSPPPLVPKRDARGHEGRPRRPHSPSPTISKNCIEVVPQHPKLLVDPLPLGPVVAQLLHQDAADVLVDPPDRAEDLGRTPGGAGPPSRDSSTAASTPPVWAAAMILRASLTVLSAIRAGPPPGSPSRA